MTGLVFDIKQCAVHDGPGLRTTVFLKGCPLRCVWCHNPEGLEHKKELMFKENLCTHCGNCLKGCTHKECLEFKRCVHACANGALSISGKDYTPNELCEILVKDKTFFEMSGGGVTFSGGEPLMQHEFLKECIRILKADGVSVAVETSGFASRQVFESIISELDFVIMDLKLYASDEHKKYTGVDNSQILENALILKSSKIPHVFRTPLIPGITDTAHNLENIEKFACGSEWEKLKYNDMADLKYKMLGKIFKYTKPEG